MRSPRRLPLAFALRCAAVLGLAWAAGACRSLTPPGVVIASTPPGARVSIDGRDAGFVTPCQIDLDDDDTRVSLELAGYAPATFVVAPDRDRWLLHWGYGYAYPAAWRLPIFLPAQDLFLPFRVDGSHSPSRVHVRLQPVVQGR